MLTNPRRIARRSPNRQRKPRLTERGLRRADEETRTLDLLHGKCARRSHPFAAVRSNPLASGVSDRASERERTRANPKPCHSCHALSPIGVPDRKVRAWGGLERRSATAYRFSEVSAALDRFRRGRRIGALGCFGDEHRLRVQQAAVSQEPSLRVVGAILYRKEAWSTTRPNCGSTGWVFTRAETKS